MIETRLACLTVERDLYHVTELVSEAILNTPEYSNDVKQIELSFHNEDFVVNRILDGLCVVALKDGEVCGACLGEDEGGVIWLSWITVFSNHQRTGVGDALLEKFIDIVRGEGIRKPLGHKIACASLMKNKASYELLIKNGFQIENNLYDHWHRLDFHTWVIDV